MRELFTILIILLYHSQEVNCEDDFAGDFYRKILEIKNSISSAFESTYISIRDSIVDNYASNRRPVQNRIYRHVPYISRNKLKEIPNFVRFEKCVCRCASHSASTPQLSASNGRTIETHVTHTRDGYILTMHRLKTIQPNAQTDKQRTQRTVLFHHGLLGSSADWILLGPNKSLPYILSDAGHDIWLANSRGNFYSRAHVSMKTDSNEFWNFSWQEIGEYDLPATLDYIRKTKNSTEPIDFIGHSMGATALLVLLSVKQDYNSYFRIAILLAPLAIMANTRGPLEMLARQNNSGLHVDLGMREFMPDRTISPLLSFRICRGMEDYCKNPLFFLTGSPMQNGTRTAEFKNKLEDYASAGGSTKTIRHYLELINNKDFHYYGNPGRRFDLQSIKTPILIISSNDDFISNVNDNRRLYLSLANPVGHIVIMDKNLSHTEFVWGFDAEQLFYNNIRDMIEVGPNVNEILMHDEVPSIKK